jgi:hypothetical protein
VAELHLVELLLLLLLPVAPPTAMVLWDQGVAMAAVVQGTSCVASARLVLMQAAVVPGIVLLQGLQELLLYQLAQQSRDCEGLGLLLQLLLPQAVVPETSAAALGLQCHPLGRRQAAGHVQVLLQQLQPAAAVARMRQLLLGRKVPTGMGPDVLLQQAWRCWRCLSR